MKNHFTSGPKSGRGRGRLQERWSFAMLEVPTVRL